MDTERTYTDLNTDIDMNLGGLGFGTGIYVNSYNNTSKYRWKFIQKPFTTTLRKQ